MRNYIVLCLSILLTWLPAQSATIHVQVKTDRAVYAVGKMVQWSIYSWTEPGQPKENWGLSLLSVHLNDDAGETLTPPLISSSGLEFQDTDFVQPVFMVFGPGEPSSEPPRLQEISVFQNPLENRLEFGFGNEDHQYLLCRGSYVLTVTGMHSLDVRVNAANYWPGPDPDDYARAFEVEQEVSAVFEVCTGIPEDINGDCHVDLIDISMLAANWLDVCITPEWCEGADIDQSGTVGLLDFSLMTRQWLWEPNPS